MQIHTMRQVLILVCFCLSLFQGMAQPCTTSIDRNTFQEGFNLVAVQATSVKKLSLSLSFIKNKCLDAAQVKTMAQLFSEDGTRLDFSKAAYNRTTDKTNFYEVYDAFTSVSFVFRLHDFVKEQTETVETIVPVISAESVVIFPNYKYPSSLAYKGLRGCEGPVVQNDLFMQAAANVFAQPTDESKQVAIANASEQFCFDFSQMMKLVTLIKTETIRFKILSSTFPSIYDLEAYKSGIVLFTDKKIQSEWLRFGSTYLAPVLEVCEESASDFEKSFKAVREKFFDHERIRIIDSYSVDHCFSVAQIKRLINEVTPASRTVDTFKRLYVKCSDKKNYATLTNELFFASEKEELMTFLRSKEK